MKRCTDDGLVEVQDHVPLGKEYMVVLVSRHVVEMFNTDRQMHHIKEVVYALNDGAGWVPTELLYIEPWTDRQSVN